MEKYTGKSILKEIAIGKILFYSKDEQVVQRKSITDTAAELARFEKAKEAAVEQLNQLYEKALKEVGEVNAAIFEVHSMMLEDEDFHDSIRNMIEGQKVNAEYAVAVAGDNFSRMFAEMDDEYFRARSADIKDIAERVVSILQGRQGAGELGDEPVILAARDLAPSETVQMDKSKLLGFVTELGSANSHTAILARTMNIPALIGIHTSETMNGKMAVIDGIKGELILDPDEETLFAYQEKKAEQERQKALLQELKGKEDVTRDGKKIRLFANIGSVGDIAKVLFIPPDPLSAPGTAVIPKIHTEFHQVLCFDVAGGMLHQRIVRTVLMLQHRAGCLEKVALKTAFGKMQRHVHQIPDAPLGVFFQPLQSLPDSGLY